MIQNAFIALLVLASFATAQDEQDAASKWGHSSHGSAYDEGPRQKPWIMEGIGHTPFPITSSNPEVQQWFDQAITLLHGFWYFEAERSLRWCLKLDPECAMAYWGMALATRDDAERSAEFLKEAIARKDTVTEREREFIEMSEAFLAVRDAEKGKEQEAKEEAMVLFDQLLMDYPDDVEAKALYWLLLGRAIGRERGLVRYGLEAVLDDILEKDPRHVGALHYRVHTWDGKEGRYAVNSCMKLPEVAPQCGHLLHMPGHVLSGIGLWHEAAIAMDHATRVEKAYMHERMIIPENNWDYVHNLDYLCFIQEQLGMVEQALIGAEQLLAGPAPVDAKYLAGMEKIATMRALLKFERWEEVLEPDRIPWDDDNPIDGVFAAYSKCRALLGLGRIDEAEDVLEELDEAWKKGEKDAEPGDSEAWIAGRVKRQRERLGEQLEALLMIAKGENLDGIALLTKAAEAQEEDWMNDPPHEAFFLYNVLGDTYLELGAPKLAAECYERTLETVFHDGFALAGLVVAYSQSGETDKAREAMAKLGVVWSDADRPNRWLAAAEATGITAEPKLETEIEQRNYKKEVLDEKGPSLWIPADAPAMTATNAEGEEVSLADFRGEKNVLLVFYLGDECVHCMEQISEAEEHIDRLAALDTIVLASSKDPLEEIAEQQDTLDVMLLSDPDFVNARAFKSFDDFEDIELHSTFLIDKEGRVHWSRIGGDPFTDFDYLEKEIRRINRRLGGRIADAKDKGTLEARANARGDS